LFGAVKKHLKGNRFKCDAEVQAAMAKLFENSLKNSTLMGLKNLFSAGGVV
jgi:hypothetical protein